MQMDINAIEVETFLYSLQNSNEQLHATEVYRANRKFFIPTLERDKKSLGAF